MTYLPKKCPKFVIPYWTYKSQWTRSISTNEQELLWQTLAGVAQLLHDTSDIWHLLFHREHVWHWDKGKGKQEGKREEVSCYLYAIHNFTSLSIYLLPHSFIHSYIIAHPYIIIHSCSTISRKWENRWCGTERATMNVYTILCFFTTTRTRPKYAVVRCRMMSRTGPHLA